MPFDDATFDGIWAHAALVHLETIADVKQSLKEFYRVLKKKSIINVYVKEQIGSKKTEIVGDKVIAYKRFFRYFTKEEIQKHMEEVGFIIKETTIRQSEKRKNLNWLCIFAQK